MEAKPLATSVQRNEEHRIPFQLLEDELGVRLAGQEGNQVRTHRVQHGDTEQELTAIVRLGLEHLLAEIVGDESVVSAELGDELVRILVEPERHPCQLKPGGPPFGSCDQRGHPVDAECPTGDVLEQRGRVDVVEGQVGLADLGQLVAHPVATPCNGEIGPGRKHQMNIGWKQIGQPAQIGDEDGVRQGGGGRRGRSPPRADRPSVPRALRAAAYRARLRAATSGRSRSAKSELMPASPERVAGRI